MGPALTVRIDNRVRLIGAADELRAPVLADLEAGFTHPNPSYDGKKNPRTTEPAFYRTFTWGDHGTLSIPRGGMWKVREALQAHCVPYVVEDRRVMGESFPADAYPAHRVELRQYQIDALKALLTRENALLRAPTGSGKTTIGTAAFAALRIPTVVIVWAGELMEQWIERAIKELGMKREDVGVIGGGEMKIRPLTIAMQQTLSSRGVSEDLAATFGCVIADEVQRFAAPTLFDAIDPWPARYRFGISADETRPDEKEFLIYDLFGRVASDIKRDDLVEQGHVLDVDIMVVPTQFDAPWYKSVVMRGGFQAKTAYSRLLKQMVEDDQRNELVLSLAFAELEQGEQVMVMSHRVEHCRILDAAINARGYLSGTLLGGGSRASKDMAGARQKLTEGKYRAIVGTTQVIGQGIDIPTLGAAVMATPVRNKQQFSQARGRVCRPSEGKKGARLYYLWDRRIYGRKALENMVAWNTRVFVLHKNSWIEARAYLKDMKSDNPQFV